MTKIKVAFTVNNKVVSKEGWELLTLLSNLSDGEYVLIVGKVEKQDARTLKQNKYYWGGVLAEIAHFSGHTVDELHEHFKLKYLRTKTKPQRVMSTTELDTEQFANYINNIVQFAAELGIVIMTPEQYYSIN